jgi:hypothetical protein
MTDSDFDLIIDYLDDHDDIKYELDDNERDNERVNDLLLTII